MFESMVNFWCYLGAVLILAELVLPGLVSVFVGLGALTVAGLLYLNHVEALNEQLIAWFASSTIYIFTLRFLVMRFYPSDRSKEDIDETHAMIGKVVEVIETISPQTGGRIRFGETTWKAVSRENEEFQVGDKVEITGRDNISWTVTRAKRES